MFEHGIPCSKVEIIILVNVSVSFKPFVPVAKNEFGEELKDLVLIHLPVFEDGFEENERLVFQQVFLDWDNVIN